jgi:hypothetical protein
MLEFTSGEQARDRWGEALRLAEERRASRLTREAPRLADVKGEIRHGDGWVRAVGRALEALAGGFRRRQAALVTVRSQLTVAGKRL